MCVAQELILKNPGVLICSPMSLAKESDDSIRNAASLVETLDANRDLVKFVAGATGVLLIATFVYAIISKSLDPATGVPYGPDWPAVYLQTIAQSPVITEMGGS